MLASLVDNKTFPLFVAGLSDGPAHLRRHRRALSSSRTTPAPAAAALDVPKMPRGPIVSVIQAQRARFNLRELLKRAYTQEANEKAALFRIIGEIADERPVPELVSRLEGKDPIARMHIINILSRFNQPEVTRAADAAEGPQQDDPRRRSRRWRAWTAGRHPAICHLLRDPEIDVQNRAIDVLIRAHDPDTIKHLIPVLKDENEYARRAAVEVLNEIGDAQAVKFLLGGHQGRRLVGAQPRRRRARQDRRPEGHRRRAAAGRATRTTTSAAPPSRS